MVLSCFFTELAIPVISRLYSPYFCLIRLNVYFVDFVDDKVKRHYFFVRGTFIVLKSIDTKKIKQK